jgi:hypothetical protein
MEPRPAHDSRLLHVEQGEVHGLAAVPLIAPAAEHRSLVVQLCSRGQLTLLLTPAPPRPVLEAVGAAHAEGDDHLPPELPPDGGGSGVTITLPTRASH